MVSKTRPSSTCESKPQSNLVAPERGFCSQRVRAARRTASTVRSTSICLGGQQRGFEPVVDSLLLVTVLTEVTHALPRETHTSQLPEAPARPADRRWKRNRFARAKADTPLSVLAGNATRSSKEPSHRLVKAYKSHHASTCPCRAARSYRRDADGASSGRTSLASKRI